MRVVQDGIMYVTGWNEIYALDATTGRQLWTYSEARHEGILSEGGIGTNRGVTISGDKAFMVDAKKYRVRSFLPSRHRARRVIA